MIRWRMHFSSAPADVYLALTTREGRESFWAEQAPESDGIIHFEFINGVRTSSEIIEAEPASRFAIRYFGALAMFDLERPRDGGTDLTLTTTEFDRVDREDLRAGWLNVLFPMKAAVDHDVDLRNHDRHRTWADGFADQ
ncbi:MAG: SRPBCC domain-containing protein [Nitriliruptorales bacterium]|nr:SRPBCC domain-containing protein [Nitriliruptorales bacterium]